MNKMKKKGGVKG